MVPIGRCSSGGRVIRDLSHLGKEVILQIGGEKTELTNG
jgi:chemotaxis protein histidine kinase CheA